MHPSLPHLMASAATTGLADSFTRDVAAAHADRLPLRVDEINSVSCGADLAVSDTFASSLWAVDAMFEMVRVGVDGVNLHTFPGAGYELFRIAHDGTHWTAAVVARVLRADPVRARGAAGIETAARVRPDRRADQDLGDSRSPTGRSG